MKYGVSVRTNDYLFSSASVIPNKLDAHIHKYYEFLYFKEVDAMYIIDDKSYMLEPGDIVITPPDVIHAISFLSDAVYSRAFIQLTPTFLSDIPRNLINNINESLQYHNFIIKKDIAKKFDLYKYFEHGSAILSTKTERNLYMAKLLFYEFAIYVNDALNDIKEKKNEKRENKVVIKIKTYLDTNYTDEIKLDIMAKKLYISKYHMCHIFKTEMGITVSDYLALKRISAVKEMFSKDTSVTNIYRQCGFNDYSTFYRTVKKYTGMAPSEFYN